MSPRLFYVDDDTSILIAANGTALAGLLLNSISLISTLRIPLPVFPMWIYLCGLVFAFLAKAMIDLINGDTRQREKLQFARDFVVETASNPNITPNLEKQMNDTWALLEKQYAHLLKPNHGPRIDKFRALFFFSSAICFLIGTSTLIYLAGALVVPETKT